MRIEPDYDLRVVCFKVPRFLSVNNHFRSRGLHCFFIFILFLEKILQYNMNTNT